MPHFTIEYSANLAARTDIGAICELVRSAAVETGIFPVGGIRVRAIRCDHYAIADGNPELCFLAMGLRLGEGRELAARKAAGEHIFAALSAYLEPVFESAKFGLTFEMVEIKSETSWKKNNIHTYLKEKEHG
ncbi:MAG: 5-carboxymethyl-2-hydroxymuconate Delta-isomerase [Xanthobacteraceae bacterium]|nr:5-carboxymethyl-2-hydroxymuconate Delta-isomerase [Xanthobacteraceae bacterium]